MIRAESLVNPCGRRCYWHGTEQRSKHKIRMCSQNRYPLFSCSFAPTIAFTGITHASKTNSTAATASARASFASIVMGLMIANTGFIRMLPHGVDRAAFHLVDKTLKLAVFLPASWIMPTIRVKTFRTTAGISDKSLASASYELRHLGRAVEACISEEIPFGNETDHAEQSGGKEELFGGSAVFRQFEKTVVTQVCQHVPKHRD